MPLAEVDYAKREAFVLANQGTGILENCIVSRTAACWERGGMYVRPPSNKVTLSEGIPSGGGAHICPDCAAYLRRSPAEGTG